MGVLSWIVLGLIAGLIARFIYPGSQPGGVLGTILLGIVGAVVGGWMGAAVGSPGPNYYSGITGMGVFWAVIGSIVVLFFYGLAMGRRHRHTVVP